MKAMKFLPVLLMVMGLGWGNATAQEPLALDDAIQLALRNSLDLQLLRNDAASAEILNHIGVAGGLPSVNGTVNDQAQVTNIYQKLATGTEIRRNNALGNNLSANIAGTVLLYNGMRVAATKDRLDQISQQSQQLLAQQIQNTIADVMLQYHETRRQSAYLKTIDGSISVAEKSLEIVQARQLAGLANNADLFQAQLDLNALQQQRLNQELVIAQAKADLLNLLNEPSDKDIVLIDSLMVDATVNFDSVKSGLRENPQLLAAERQIAIQALIEKEIAAQRYPALRANAGYNFGNNQSSGGFNLISRTYGPYIGLNLSVPIYNGGALKRQEEVAALNTRSAQVQKEILLDDQMTSLTKTWLAYQNALQLLKTERANYDLSQKLLALMQQKYELRQSTILELREAQESYEESGFRLINLEFAAKAAEIELKRLSGGLR